MINHFQNPTVENFYWNIFIKKVFLPWYLPKSGQLSLISCQINYWPRSKNWKIFLSRLSKTFTEFCVFFPNSLARVLFKNGLNFFRLPILSPQSILEKSAVLKTYYPVLQKMTQNMEQKWFEFGHNVYVVWTFIHPNPRWTLSNFCETSLFFGENIIVLFTVKCTG